MNDQNVYLEFGGGIELLFGSKTEQLFQLPAAPAKWIIKDLLVWMRDNLLQERPELFLQDDSVRPGILVLVNDTDWELLDTINYVIKAQDRILFISTLHGG